MKEYKASFSKYYFFSWAIITKQKDAANCGFWQRRYNANSQLGELVHGVLFLLCDDCAESIVVSDDMCRFVLQDSVSCTMSSSNGQKRVDGRVVHRLPGRE